MGVQLAWRLRALIAADHLTPGDRLPSVRDLAAWAGVNVNTVRGVYARLEDEGLVATEHGRGTFVAAGAVGSPEAERIADAAIGSAREAGIDPRDVAIVALVSASLPTTLPELELPGREGREEEPEPDPGALEEQLAAELDLHDAWLKEDDISARRELRRQIGRIEAQLASYRRDLDPPARRITPAEPRIAHLAELERTRDAMLSQLAVARGRAQRRAQRERRAREVRDSVEPRPGPLGALMNWWRVKVSGGCPLAVPREAALRARAARA